jgi:hypothetical protein
LRLRTKQKDTLVEAVHIDPVGNVGIGTTGPTEKLHVNGNIMLNHNLMCIGTHTPSIRILFGTIKRIREGQSVEVNTSGGFGWRWIDRGRMLITFNPGFADIPCVVATQAAFYDGDVGGKKTWWSYHAADNDTKDNAVVVEINPTYTVIKTGNGNGDPEERSLCFLAIGVVA